MERDIGWSEKRRQSSRTLAFYIESQGKTWTSIREAVRGVAGELGIPQIERRSAIAVACQDRLLELGISPPVDYVAPWLRSGATIFVRSGPKRKFDQFVAFYDSIEWRRLRFRVLRDRGRRCECCRATGPDVVLHVDHIKPLRRHWHLRLDQANLQVLCEACNRGKGGRDETDFRPVLAAQ